ncbi:hypothetical protein E9993_21135 [Labilibacter sediminis]|nr:hypothetical protein E9993_21135 [Labilibacter sediminis]
MMTYFIAFRFVMLISRITCFSLKKMSLWILFIFICTSHAADAQKLQGKVTSLDGESIPFASIYIKELTTGTTTNLDGEYSIQFTPGTYHVFFQALGFSRIEEVVVIKDKDIIKNIVLKPQDYKIKEVRVYSGKEDPAYAIMRKSISLAPYFLRQVKHFKANVYLKGGLDMKKVPRLFRKQLKEEGIEQGQTYVAESVNEIKFDAPNKYEHTQISKQSTIPDDSETDVMQFINYSFYDSDDELAISPLSRKAFSFYRFRYEGFFQQGEFYVNKIKVTPKRKNQKLFEGYIFIVDQLWNIHSVDLMNEQFFGKIRVKQVQEPVKGKAWLPVSHMFDVDVKVMGFKLTANYGGSVKYSVVELDEDLPVPASLKKAYFDQEQEVLEEEKLNLTKNQQKIEDLLKKDDLNTREMLKLSRLMEKENEEREHKGKGLELENFGSNYKVVKDTVKRDSVDWDKMRSIPLSKKELQSLQVKDSLELVRAQAKNDTTKTKKEKTAFQKKLGHLLYGRKYYVGDSTLTIRHDGLAGMNAAGFNAVDGWTYQQSFELIKRIDSVHRVSVKPALKYAFNRKQFLWKVHSNYTFLPLKRGLVGFNVGQWSNNFNELTGVSPFINSISSLFFKDNYMRLYQDNYLKAGLSFDIANGLRFRGRVAYHAYDRLENSTNYSWGYPSIDYKPNNDLYHHPDAAFDSRKSFDVLASLSYTPKHYYRIVKGKKRMVHSDYPTFAFEYRAAYDGVLESESSFEMMELSVNQDLEWSYMYGLDYEFKAGYYFSQSDMHFSQYSHMNTSQIPISFKNWKNNFNLLNDYEYSTNEWYLEGHVAFSTPYLMFKYLPFLQDKLWNENLYLHHLTQPYFKNYNEIGYGISQIFLMMNVGVFAGFEDFEFARWGARLSFKFDFE